MENREAPDSPPLVTYPMDAAAPGYNWHDNRPSPDVEEDHVYVPVPGDEDYQDGDFTICREIDAPPVQSLSAMMRAQSISFATPSVPSISRQLTLRAPALHFRQLRLQLLNFD